MLFSDSYIEITTQGMANLRERGSRFLAFALPVKSEEEAKIKLQELRVFYPDATHHCFAFVLNPDQSAQRFNDDGEPSNSAGRPILRAIISQGLTNVLVVVVRYFGGTMLGIPGLIQAYGEAAKLALENAEREEKYIEDEFVLRCNFEHEQEVHRLISRFKARILDRNYEEGASFRIAVRRNQVEDFKRAVKEAYLIQVDSTK